MKLLRVLFFSCFLYSGVVKAAAPDSCQDTIEISSLPYTITQSDTCYAITGNLVSNADGIVFAVGTHNVRLVLADYTIEYGADGGSYESGIKTTGDVHDIVVQGGTVFRDQGPTDAYGSANRSFWIASGGYNVTLDTVDLICDAHDGKCMYVWEGAAAKNIVINGGTWTSNSEDFTSRHLYTGAVGYFGNPPDPDPGGYNYILNGVTITNGPCQGLAFNMSSVVWIHDCTLTVDGTNTPPSSENANTYAILVKGPGPGSLIENNVIISGTSRGGSRGILIEDADGDPDDWVIARNNHLYLWRGPSAENPTGLMFGIRVRSLDGHTCEYVRVYGNTLYTLADTLTSTSHIGMTTVALGLKLFNYGSGSPAHHIEAWDNTVYAIALTAGTEATAAEIVAYGTVDTSQFLFADNNLYASNRAFTLADVPNGRGCRNAVFQNTTIGVIDGTMTDSTFVNDFETWHVGVSNLDANPTATGNIGIDNQFAAGGDPTDVNFNPAPGPGDLRQMRTVELYVAGNQGDSLPLQNAACSLWNTYGHLIVTGTTDVNGKVSDLVSVLFDEESGQDSTFNDFIFKAVAGSKSETDSNFTVGFATGENLDTAWLDTIGSGWWEGSPGPAGPKRIRGVKQ